MTGLTARADSTRYTPPSLPHPLLQRARLMERMTAAERHRLTLVHADAGYGKTTLAVQYADLLRAAGRRAAWLTLYRGDEDPLVLLADLIGALQRDREEFGARILASLGKTKRLERHLAQLAEAFCEDLAGVGECVLFVDDHPQLHAGPAYASFLGELIELLPPNEHLVFTTRDTPQLSGLSRWRLAGEVLDISAAELAFTRDEAADLLRDEFALELPDHAADAIYARTGGWPAGLRIAAAFVRDHGWESLAEFRGSGSQLYEYFDAEVLARRSQRIADLLVRWSLLDRLEAVTSGPDAGGLIESLQQAGLVVRDGNAYRFQPLFGEFLRARAQEVLPATEIVALHREYAERALAAENVDQAISHLQRAGDHKRAAQLLREHGERLLVASEIQTLQRWLDGFPPGMERTLPWVLLLRGALHRVRGDYERALAHYRDAADLFRRSGDNDGLARALLWSAQALRYLRRPREALERAREGHVLVPAGASQQAAWLLHIIGGSLADLGDSSGAADAYLRADGMFGLLGDHVGQLNEALAIAQLHHSLGEFDEAQRAYLRALALQPTTADVNVLCWTQAGLVDVRARRGDTGEALDVLRQSLETANANGLPLVQAAMCATLMTVHELAGERGAAEEMYRAGVELCRDQGDAAVPLALHTAAAELRALRGEAVAAREALRAGEATVAEEGSAINVARLLLARGAVLAAEGQSDAARQSYHDAYLRATSAGAHYLAAKATLLGNADGDDASAAEALRAVARERYRDFLLLRPELLDRLRERLPDLGFSPDETRELAAILAPVPVATAAPPVSATTAENLQVFLLGPFEVRADGSRISDRGWRTSKTKELFALLLLERHRHLARDELIERLWPRSEITAAVSNFHFTLHALRKALATAGAAEATVVSRVDAGYQLALPSGIHVDIELFARSLRRARDAKAAGRSLEAVQQLRAAVAVHRGEFLADLSGEWIERRREELNREFVAAARELAALELEWKDPRAAIRPLERLLEREPYDEEAHRLLMRAYHESGDVALALRHYQALVTLLSRDLGEEPEPATKELYLRYRKEAQ